MINLPNSTLIKVNFRCEKKHKKELMDSTCLIPISVGQSYHEGDKFIATMDLVNTTFSNCHIIVCDTVQRHTLLLNNPQLSTEEAFRITFLNGQAWVERNKIAFAHMKTKVTLTHWDEWLNHPSYLEYCHEIVHLFKTDQPFKSVAEETIQMFLKRQKPIDEKKAYLLCKEYLLEECPIIPLWFNEAKADYVLYPKIRTKAMEKLHDYYIKNHGLNSLNGLSLKFDLRKNGKSLSFPPIHVKGFLSASLEYL